MLCRFETLDLKLKIANTLAIASDQSRRPFVPQVGGSRRWERQFLRDALKFDDDVMQFFRAIGELGPLLTNQFDCTVEEVPNLFRKKSVNLASNVGGIPCA